MMAQSIISDCTRCRLPAGREATPQGPAHELAHSKKTCAPIIDAEKSNEALRIVAFIRSHTGSGFLAFTAE
jgi:hypothetical protein